MFALRNKKEEEEIPIPEENEEEEQKVIGAVKISGEEAKNFMDFVKKLVAKKKEGE